MELETIIKHCIVSKLGAKCKVRHKYCPSKKKSPLKLTLLIYYCTCIFSLGPNELHFSHNFSSVTFTAVKSTAVLIDTRPHLMPCELVWALPEGEKSCHNVFL